MAHLLTMTTKNIPDGLQSNPNTKPQQSSMLGFNAVKTTYKLFSDPNVEKIITKLLENGKTRSGVLKKETELDDQQNVFYYNMDKLCERAIVNKETIKDKNTRRTHVYYWVTKFGENLWELHLQLKKEILCKT